MMIHKIKKAIRIIAFIAVFIAYSGNAYAIGIPTFFKKYLADVMRTWTVGTISKKKATKYYNNAKLAEENAERGNNIESNAMYSKMVNNMDWERFGRDPLGTFQDASEKTMDQELQEYAQKQKKKAEDYIDKKKNERKKKQADKKKKTTGNENGKSDSKNGEYRDQVFKWLQKNSAAVATTASSAASGDRGGVWNGVEQGVRNNTKKK